MSKQELPHFVSPNPKHSHVPTLQYCEAEQTVPQLPQLALSFGGSHTPAQCRPLWQ
jgi:hypothetical protein